MTSENETTTTTDAVIADLEGQLGDLRASLSAAEAEVDRLRADHASVFAAARGMVQAANAMRGRFADADDAARAQLWRDVHLGADDLADALEVIGERFGPAETFEAPADSYCDCVVCRTQRGDVEAKAVVDGILNGPRSEPEQAEVSR